MGGAAPVAGVKLVQIGDPPRYVTIEMPQDSKGHFVDMGRSGPLWEQIEAHIRQTAGPGGNYAEIAGVNDSHTAGKEYRCGGPDGRGGKEGCNKFRPGASGPIGACTFVEKAIHGIQGSCMFDERYGLNDFELDLGKSKFTKEEADYGERPSGLPWGCGTDDTLHCQVFARWAKSTDSQGRKIWCGKWGMRVMQADKEGWRGCCRFNSSPGDIAFKGNKPYIIDVEEYSDDDDEEKGSQVKKMIPLHSMLTRRNG